MTEAELSGVRGLVLDLDGTLYDRNGLIAGAASAIAALRGAGVAVCFATNTTRHPRGVLVDRLRRLGVELVPKELLTAPLAAVSWLRERGVQSVALHLAAATEVEFASFDRDDRSPGAVVVGDLGDDWTFDRLNRAFRQVMAGADLVAVQKNRYWQTADGLTLDAGPFVAALEYATGKDAVVVGKPAAAFFDAAARLLGLRRSEMLMVGDDIASDVGGAVEAGMLGALVRTGKFRAADLTHGVEAPAVIDSVADLPELLRIRGTLSR